MKKLNNQTGSAHVVIIIILVIAILGLLGFVFWQNFIQHKATTPAASTTTSTAATPAVTYKTYTEPSYGISFNYPSSWTVKVVSDPPLNSNGLLTLQLTVADSTGQTVANLSTMFQGGQTCDSSASITLQTSDLTNLSLGGATAPAVYLADIYSDSTGAVKLVYGIAPAADASSTNGSSTITCNDQGSIFARLPIRGVGVKAPYGNVAFYNTTTYSTVQDAQAFLQSSTYTQAAQMIKSLTTTAITQ